MFYIKFMTTNSPYNSMNQEPFSFAKHFFLCFLNTQKNNHRGNKAKKSNFLKKKRKKIKRHIYMRGNINEAAWSRRKIKNLISSPL